MKRAVTHLFFSSAQPSHMRSNRRALIYAALVHLVLLIVLLYGMRWKNKPSAGAEAELWSAAEVTPPLPEQRRPPVRAQPAQLAPAQSTFVRPDSAEIALERARQRQQQEQEKQRLRQQQHTKQQPQEQKKTEQREVLQEKQQTAQQAKEKTKEEAQIEQQRQARLAALANAAGTDAGRAATAGRSDGSGAGVQGSPSYADKVQQRVKPNLVFDPQTLNGNPQTVVLVQCAPDGTILNAQIARPSGSPAWDDAVLRAVQKSNPMPRDTNGRAPSRFTITFRPKD